MKRKIEFLPVPYGKVPEDSIVIIIDVIRATSTIATFFGEGGKEVFIVERVDEAFALRETLKEEVLLAGERGGLKVEGFDFDNSPIALKNSDIKNKTLVLTTTNGTRAIKRYKDVSYLFVGAFLNLDALTEEVSFLSDKKGLDVFVICAGKEDRVVSDDFLCGGAYVDALSNRGSFSLTDGANIAREFYVDKREDIYNCMFKSESGQNILRYGKRDDIAFISIYNRYQVIPCLLGREPLVIKNCQTEEGIGYNKRGI